MIQVTQLFRPDPTYQQQQFSYITPVIQPPSKSPAHELMKPLEEILDLKQYKCNLVNVLSKDDYFTIDACPLEWKVLSYYNNSRFKPLKQRNSYMLVYFAYP